MLGANDVVGPIPYMPCSRVSVRIVLHSAPLRSVLEMMPKGEAFVAIARLVVLPHILLDLGWIALAPRS